MSCLNCGCSTYGFDGALCPDCRDINHADCRRLTAEELQTISDIDTADSDHGMGPFDRPI